MSGVVVPPRAYSVVYTFRQQHLGTGCVLNLVAAALVLLMATMGTAATGTENGVFQEPVQQGSDLRSGMKTACVLNTLHRP
jgi:predicted RecA/RadA family phage recombinase